MQVRPSRLKCLTALGYLAFVLATYTVDVMNPEDFEATRDIELRGGGGLHKHHLTLGENTMTLHMAGYFGEPVPLNRDNITLYDPKSSKNPTVNPPDASLLNIVGLSQRHNAGGSRDAGTDVIVLFDTPVELGPFRPRRGPRRAKGVGAILADGITLALVETTADKSALYDWARHKETDLTKWLDKHRDFDSQTARQLEGLHRKMQKWLVLNMTVGLLFAGSVWSKKLTDDAVPEWVVWTVIFGVATVTLAIGMGPLRKIGIQMTALRNAASKKAAEKAAVKKRDRERTEPYKADEVDQAAAQYRWEPGGWETVGEVTDSFAGERQNENGDWKTLDLGVEQRRRQRNRRWLTLVTTTTVAVSLGLGGCVLTVVKIRQNSQTCNDKANELTSDVTPVHTTLEEFQMLSGSLQFSEMIRLRPWNSEHDAASAINVSVQAETNLEAAKTQGVMRGWLMQWNEAPVPVGRKIADDADSLRGRPWLHYTVLEFPSPEQAAVFAHTFAADRCRFSQQIVAGDHTLVVGTTSATSVVTVQGNYVAELYINNDMDQSDKIFKKALDYVVNGSGP